MEALAPIAHWQATLDPLLSSLEPRGVWVPGSDELSEQVRRLVTERLEPVPGEFTDLAVISGDPNYHWVSSCLDEALTEGVGGEQGPPVLVVSATGWPYGQRDGYRDPASVPAVARRAYARTLPDPDAHWLSPEAAPIASALEPGGERNGVLAALDGLRADPEWECRLLEGFGGIGLLAPRRRLERSRALAQAWAGIGSAETLHALLRELDLERGRQRLHSARLEHALGQERAAHADLGSIVRSRLAALEEEAEVEEEQVRALDVNLSRVGGVLRAGVQRTRRLEHALAEQRRDFQEALTAQRRELGGRQRELEARRRELEGALAGEREANESLRATVAETLTTLEAETETEQARLGDLAQTLRRLAAKLEAAQKREQRLENRLIATEAQATAAREELLDERRWVAAQARSIASSQAWRVGHQIARTTWILRRRRQAAPDALEQMIGRMERRQLTRSTPKHG